MESISVSYLEKGANEIYNISTEKFLPSIIVCNSFAEVAIERDTDKCNDPTYWKISFQQELPGGNK